MSESANQKTAVKAIYFSVAGNTLLSVIKWLTGYFGNSYALIADAIESTADIMSSLLVLVGIKYIHRPADENHPYGHGRLEPLVTFVVVAFLVVSAFIIAYQSVLNIQTPHELPKVFTLYVLGPLIIWKEISFRLVMQKAKQANSSALKADAWHHRSDAITSIAAFFGISIALIFEYAAADDWAALFASAIILYNSYKIFRPALGEIMDENLYEDVIAEIRKVAAGVEGVVTTEKCYVRKAGAQFHVDLHVEVDATITVKEGHHIAHVLQDALKQQIPNIGHILIHIEPDK